MHLVLYTATPAIGGAEAVARLVVRDARTRWQVTVVGPNAPANAVIVDGHADVRTVHTPRVRNKFDLRNALAVRRTIRRLQPDVVHFNLTDMCSCLAELTVVATVRGPAMVAVEHSGWAPTSRFQRWAKRRSVRWLDGHVAVSADLASKVAQVSQEGFEQITVIPNGVASVEDDPDAVSETGERLRLGVVTRLTEGKGVDLLIEAMVQLPDAELHIAGDGPAFEPLVAQAAALGVADRVRFHGWLADPRDIYASIDVFVHPSRADIMPISVIEAMQHALPVIATRVGNIPELVQDGQTGLLIEPDDGVALVNAIDWFAHHRDEGVRFGLAGRERSRKRYDASAMTAAYDAVYRQAIERVAQRRWRATARTRDCARNVGAGRG